MSKHKYESDIELSKRYRDPQTGIEGTATAISFYQYACERVSIETVVAGKIEEYAFDAPRLVPIDTAGNVIGDRARTKRTGGPGRPVPQPSSISR